MKELVKTDLEKLSEIVRGTKKIGEIQTRFLFIYGC